MIEKNTSYEVKNRSTSVVVYKIPETGLRREFAPGETKRITFDELEKLTYQEGGRELLENFLQILTEEVTQDLNVRTEVEYKMSEEQVVDLLKEGSLDAFLDALDFAPVGVLDLIKLMAVQLPLEDTKKKEALKKKTGFDVEAAIRHQREESKEEKGPEIEEPVSGRRVKEVKEEDKTRRVVSQ
nr:MAG TPA: hypothetical protein [Caudoviricetes sp.]